MSQPHDDEAPLREEIIKLRTVLRKIRANANQARDRAARSRESSMSTQWMNVEHLLDSVGE